MFIGIHNPNAARPDNHGRNERISRQLRQLHKWNCNHLFYAFRPAPVSIGKFRSCIESLTANKQFQPQFLVSSKAFFLDLWMYLTIPFLTHFKSLKSTAESGLVKDYRLTKVTAGLHKGLNRYTDMVPCKSIYIKIPLLPPKQFTNNPRFLDDQSLVLLGRDWPLVLNDPEPDLDVSKVIYPFVIHSVPLTSTILYWHCKGPHSLAQFESFKVRVMLCALDVICRAIIPARGRFAKNSTLLQVDRCHEPKDEWNEHEKLEFT